MVATKDLAEPKLRQAYIYDDIYLVYNDSGMRPRWSIFYTSIRRKFDNDYYELWDIVGRWHISQLAKNQFDALEILQDLIEKY